MVAVSKFITKEVEKEEHHIFDDSFPKEWLDMSKPLNEIKLSQEIEASDNSNNPDYLIQNGIDFNHGISLLGEKSMYDETLKDFLAGIDERMAKLKEYKSDGNCADYAVEAHALKSDSKYLGFTKLADDALNHEMAGKNDKRLAGTDADTTAADTTKAANAKAKSAFICYCLFNWI